MNQATQPINGAAKEIPPYRAGLPDRPRYVKLLPLSDKGYPIPFFVTYIDGKSDFRVIDPVKFIRCVRFQLCWICGQPLGRYHTYVGGPLGMLNRISGEPPSHYECASYAARACPFILYPNARRREAGLPADTKDLGGTMVLRNPGVTVLWTTVEPIEIEARDDSLLFHLPPPDKVEWMKEGRAATRHECIESTEAGLPELYRLVRGAEEEDLVRERLIELYKLLPEEA